MILMGNPGTGPINPSRLVQVDTPVPGFPSFLNDSRRLLDTVKPVRVQSSTPQKFDGVKKMDNKNPEKSPDKYVPDFEVSNPGDGDDPDSPIRYRPTTPRERREVIGGERGSDNGK